MIKPFPNVPSHLNALGAKEHELFVITARSEFLKPLIFSFLAKYYPMIPSNHVYFSQTFLNTEPTRKSKTTIAQELNVEIFVER